jgi:integrase
VGSIAFEVLDGINSGEHTPQYVLSGQNDSRPYGGLPKAIKRIMARRPELAGVTAHTLRHSFASVADELGYTEATVAALLGQQSGSVTRRYIHHLDSALTAAAERVSAHIHANMSHTPACTCVDRYPVQNHDHRQRFSRPSGFPAERNG